jgi:hypothetical protein
MLRPGLFIELTLRRLLGYSYTLSIYRPPGSDHELILE